MPVKETVIETQSAEALKTIYVTFCEICRKTMRFIGQIKQYVLIVDLLGTKVLPTDDKSCFQL